MNLEHRDALARVIDPDAWDLHDDRRMDGKNNLKKLTVHDSRKLADRIIESGLMHSHEWDSREYINARNAIKERTSRTGKCYSVEDALDGYFMHDVKCPKWPNGAIGGSGCIK